MSALGSDPLDLGLAGQVAVVTGGGQGIGGACVRELIAAGASVVVADVDLDTARALADEMGPAARAIDVNVCDPAACEAMVDLAVSEFGKLTAAVNAAGIGSRDKPDLAETDPNEFRRIVDVDLTGTFLSMRAEIAAMLSSGGSILNVASILGVVGGRGNSSYVASKHGVVGLTKTAALEYAARGVRVNAIGPGFTATRQMEALDEDRRRVIADAHPIGRVASPGEIGAAVALLLSPVLSFMTGAYIPVDGGYTAQ
jgi:NAD(P)-dependent dehydrogenase (short-subunit alcohol dehydrogenase family)